VCSTATAASACSRSTSRRGTQVRNAIDRGPHVDAAAPEVPERSPTTIGQGDDHEFDDPGDAARPKAGGPVYPVRAHAGWDGPLSRRLWLVKWLLILPHVLVLIPLWIGFLLLSLVALVAIVVTGRYPRSLFAFNVGVLRWTWRVDRPVPALPAGRRR
jgi:hypothetical protein